MPFATGNVWSVLIQGIVYIGGRGFDVANKEYIVMAYDTRACKWTTLPPYQASWFAMTTVDNQLVLVGGRMPNGGRSKALGVWRAGSKKWTYPYPDMTTPRSECSAVSYKHWVVVTGGWGAFGKLSSVDIMNTDTKQWYAGPPTPITWNSMKTAVVGNMCYFMGGVTGGYDVKKVYCAPLPAIVDNSSRTEIQIWKELPELPHKFAAPLSIGGSLLAVGGEDEDGKGVSTIHLYLAGFWMKVGDMPIQKSACTSIMISDTELLVAGGVHHGLLSSMHIAQIL